MVQMNLIKRTHLIALIVVLFSVNNVYAETLETVTDVMKSDANNDGKVSFEEYKAAHEARMTERFKARDINQDGFIDLEEKVVAKEKKKAEHQAEKEAEKEKLREKYREERKKRRKHFYKYQ